MKCGHRICTIDSREKESCMMAIADAAGRAMEVSLVRLGE